MWKIVLLVYSVILLCILISLSVVGMTIYDSVVYSNHTNSTEIIEAEIVKTINETTMDRFLFRGDSNIYFVKTVPIKYELTTDTLSFNNSKVKLSDIEHIIFYLAPHLKKVKN